MCKPKHVGRQGSSRIQIIGDLLHLHNEDLVIGRDGSYSLPLKQTT